MSNWFNLKLKSGALQLTVFIIAVIAILLAAVLTLTYVHRFFIEQSKASIKIIKNSNDGFQHLFNSDDNRNDTLLFSKNDEENSYQIRTHQSNWGIFEKGWVETSYRTRKFKKIGLIGSSFKEENRPALYLKETFKPLVVVGETEIRGLSFLPEQGVKSGNIAGESYYGTQLIYGPTQKSGVKLPEIKKSVKNFVSQFISSNFQLTNENYLENGNPKNTNSFFSPTKYIKSSQIVRLENCSLTGNIIVKSDTLVSIRKSALLRDIIVVAPYVEIEEGFNGNLQVFSTKSIRIQKNCTLNYPSALILVNQEKEVANYSSPNNQIFIDSGTIVSGTVCYFSTAVENNFGTQVILQPQSQVRGELYCEGNIEVMGWINGTLYAHQFVSNKAGSVFMNHLFNAKISSEKIQPEFAGILFENNLQISKKKSIIKWLY
ncbi:MAG TPA: hypothetical protein PLL09_01165 [Flavobacterium sp.]|uniref:hypothetical protein n=1 Tax=unclassified Flavobacterium TaxID=196869 RepID=UPI000E8C3FF0|nr:MULTISPECIES: hypothetical protein [unclassified Flavobacterium]HBI00705.1 hypothetical protein [Flavobacterium sp.]HRE76410.1 hypothetical protein [Flavobacterium sp.]